MPLRNIGKPRVQQYAKTLYKPVRPPHIDNKIRAYTSRKVPHFFVYAKDKTEAQVEPPNDSPVNRLEKIIPHMKMDFQFQALGKFDPKVLMRDELVPTNDITQKIIDTYTAMSQTDAMKAGTDERGRPRSLYGYQQIIDSLLAITGDIHLIVDVLIRELFIRRKSKRKNIFWMCFGDVVAENIKRNIGLKTGICVKCGARFYRESNRQLRCKSCAAKAKRESDRLAKRRQRQKSQNLEKQM